MIWKDGKDGVVWKGGVAVIGGGWLLGWAAPFGRPVALTLGPPLSLPLGGGGRWLAGEGTRCYVLGVLLRWRWEWWSFELRCERLERIGRMGWCVVRVLR